MFIGAAYAAHELRTPVALQLALAEATLADPRADGVAWRAMAEGVIASCEHQGRLIDALLDLACSQHGLARVERVDLAALAREASDGGCIATLEPAVVAGDPILLERLVANLVSNAIRHNIPDGRIEVSTRANSGHAVLSVANTGPLVPPCELGRLFQPFERLGSQPRRCADGTGLGLAIVRSIADAHDATITAQAPAAGGLEIEVSFRV
jgi:signal transduction histidine kinase